MTLFSAVKRQEKLIAAAGKVSETEEFFQDHFPDFPVVPGVLILEIFRKAVQSYFEDREADFFFTEIRSVKFTNYLRPGDAWEVQVDQVSVDGEVSGWKGRLFSAGRSICSAQFFVRQMLKEK